MAVFIDRALWIASTLLFVFLCPSPAKTGDDETAANCLQCNSSECKVVIKSSSTIATYHAAYQPVSILVTAGCLSVTVNENDFVNLEHEVSKNFTNGCQWAKVEFLHVTANTTVVFSVFASLINNSLYQTDIVVHDINFVYEIGCTSVELSWTLLPGFIYSVEAVCAGSVKTYSNLTKNSLSMQPFGDQAFCNVFLKATRSDGGTLNQSLTTSLFRDPSQCVENIQLDEQWNQASVQLTFLLKLSCSCLSEQPTVIYIDAGLENSKSYFYANCSLHRLECVSGNGSLANVSRPSDRDIKVVIHVPVLQFPCMLTTTARACNPTGCTKNSTKTIVSPEPSKSSTYPATINPSTSQTGAVPGPTATTPNNDDSVPQIVGGVIGGLVCAVILSTLALCVCCICRKYRRKDAYNLPVAASDHRAAESSTKNKTTSEPDVAVKLESGSIEQSPEERRHEPEVLPVASQNPLFIGGAVSGTESNSGNPTAAPSSEEEKPVMVSSRGTLTPSSSAVNRHGIALREDQLQAKFRVLPAENTSQVANPPPNEPTITSIKEASQESEDVSPTVPT